MEDNLFPVPAEAPGDLMLETDRSGAAKNSLANCCAILTKDPLFAGAFRRNLLTDRIDVVRDLGWPRRDATLTETDMKRILLHCETNYGITSDKRLDDAMQIITDDEGYHPIRERLYGLRWDGVPRIRHALHHFLGAKVTDYNEEALRVFMNGAVERVMNPGCKFELMLCLVGGQGAGKSTFFRMLAMEDAWFTDDLHRLDDENVYRKLAGHWIIEMSEMIATANTKSIEEIKSFLSRQREVYKVPYETHAKDRPRQCVFGGTTNRMDFLPRDRTGSRRFMPVMIHPEEREIHILEDPAESRAYIEQMWAEIMAHYLAGDYHLSLSKEGEAARLQEAEEHMPEDTEAGQILDFLEHYEGDRVCSKLLYREALGHPSGDPKAWETREICEIMNTAIENGSLTGWEACNGSIRFRDFGRQRGWIRASCDEDNPFL